MGLRRRRTQGPALQAQQNGHCSLRGDVVVLMAGEKKLGSSLRLERDELHRQLVTRVASAAGVLRSKGGRQLGAAEWLSVCDVFEERKQDFCV